MRTVISADSLLDAPEQLSRPFVVLEDDRIAAIGSQAATPLPRGEHLHFAGATLAAPFFDVHVHGCCGHDVMTGTPESLRAVGSFAAAHGVCAYLPTTITAPEEPTLRSLSALADRIEAPGQPGVARPLGIHIEGPFLSVVRKGAHPEHNLRAPSISLLDAMWQAARGHIRLMTVAPELPGALDLIRHANGLGIRTSIGHSNATFDEATRALELGVHSATHTFNAMRPFEQREPGILGAVLNDPALYAELICDGLHVHPAAVRLMLSAKKPERIVLVTDAMAATGMPDGNYKLGELDVRLEKGRCLIGENTLAGSTLTLDRAVRNFAEFTRTPLALAARLASRNPARMAGFSETVGKLEAGRSGDLLVLSGAGEVQGCWVAGARAGELTAL
jgi:N-acetylglucosamine-6-phosphate deacetylase